MNAESMVQIGVVSDVDKAKRMARVIWPASGQTSGWLYVLQHFGAELNIVLDNEHTHQITDTHGGGLASTEPDHNHSGSTVTIWLPKVNESVLVIYMPVEDGDGFVIGRVT